MLHQRRPKSSHAHQEQKASPLATTFVEQLAKIEQFEQQNAELKRAYPGILYSGLSSFLTGALNALCMHYLFLAPGAWLRGPLEGYIQKTIKALEGEAASILVPTDAIQKSLNVFLKHVASRP